VREQYRRCRLLVFPGEEDFGIVPLEAQSCGKPVVAYGRGGALETVRPAKPASSSQISLRSGLLAAIEDAASRTWNPPSSAATPSNSPRQDLFLK
jgi:glycosyltransferase involved in cell wall biosynthesis